MEPLLPFLIFPVALFFVVFSAHYVLRGAEGLGKVLGVKPFFVGALIVALGTSLPELAVSLFSVFGGALEVPVAGVIGSNITNIFLILGVTAVLMRTVVITKDLIDVEIPLLVAATVLGILAVYDGVVYPFEALVLLAACALYFIYLFREHDPRALRALSAHEELRRFRRVPSHLLFLFGGAIVLAIASYFVVQSTISVAQFFGISEGVVAATVIALGTSLPELAVSVRAALRKQVELVVGNVIGSNVFNILLIIGFSGIFSYLPVDARTLTIGIPVLIAATVLCVVSCLSRRVHVWEGGMYLLAYTLFLLLFVGL